MASNYWVHSIKGETVFVCLNGKIVGHTSKNDSTGESKFLCVGDLMHRGEFELSGNGIKWIQHGYVWINHKSAKSAMVRLKNLGYPCHTENLGSAWGIFHDETDLMLSDDSIVSDIGNETILQS